MIEITRSISIENQHIGQDINKKIGEKLNLLIGDCNEDYGYIIKICSFKIIDTLISRATTSPIIKLRIQIINLKPHVGDIYQCTVLACAEGNGIYAIHADKLRIRIAENSISDFKFINGAYKIGSVLIENGTVINVEVVATKYELNNFICIGIINSYKN